MTRALKDYSQTMAKLSDSELLHIIENPGEINPGALQAALVEWESRKIPDTDLDTIRQRRETASELSQQITSFSKIVDSYWKRVTAWLDNYPPQMQLLIKAGFIQLCLSVHDLFNAWYYSYFAFSEYYGWTWFESITALVYIGGGVFAIAAFLYLVKLKKWAYWYFTFSLALGYMHSLVELPFYLPRLFDGPISNVRLADFVFLLVQGVGIVTGLLMLYLLTRGNVREYFRVSRTVMVRLLIVGALFGAGLAGMKLYNGFRYNVEFENLVF